MTAHATYDFGAQQATDRFSDMVEQAVNGADYLRDALAGSPASMPELARLFAAIRDAQAKLAMLQRECEANLADAVKACGEREPEVPGVGVLKVRPSKKQEWDSALLLPQVLDLVGSRVADHVTVPDEVRDEYAAAMHDVLQTVAPVNTKSFGWKAGGLREAGIDPDSYRATTDTGWRVQIVSEGGV